MPYCNKAQPLVQHKQKKITTQTKFYLQHNPNHYLHLPKKTDGQQTWWINMFSLTDVLCVVLSTSSSIRILQNKTFHYYSPLFPYLACHTQMNTQQTNITHGLLLLFLLLLFFSSFLHHYNNKTLQPIIHNPINSSTNHLLNRSHPYMHHKCHYSS